MDDAEASAFVLRAIAVAPGCERAYVEDEWHDAIVVVKRGEIELEWLDGTSHRFGRGDLLWLTGLPVRVLRNRGSRPALLVGVSRQ